MARHAMVIALPSTQYVPVLAILHKSILYQIHISFAYNILRLSLPQLNMSQSAPASGELHKSTSSVDSFDGAIPISIPHSGDQTLCGLTILSSTNGRMRRAPVKTALDEAPFSDPFLARRAKILPSVFILLEQTE